MRKEDCRKGMLVVFGCENGEKTIGKVVKLNQKTARIETFEDRGSRTKAGQTWRVGYSLIEPHNGDVSNMPMSKPEPIKFSPFDYVTAHLMAAANIIYGQLSPENLSCDGEASYAHMKATSARCNRQLKGIFSALGREVDETECWQFCEEQRKWEQERQRA